MQRYVYSPSHKSRLPSTRCCRCMTRRYALPSHFSVRMEFSSYSMPPDFLALPSTQSQQAVIQRRAVVCTGVKVFRVFLDGFHNLQRAGTAFHTGTFDADAVLFQIREDALLRVLLAETHVSIAIAVALWASFSSQGIAKASFVSALASFVGSLCPR